MIPDRAPQQKSQCLTMLCYQQMPMVPRNPSNAEQRKLVAASPHHSPVQSVPTPKKAIGRPRKHPVKAKCADPQKAKGEKLSAMHDVRIRKHVAELFGDGPLTVDMVMRAIGYTVRQAAGRRVLDWRDRGLIVEYVGPKTGDGRRDMAKWWGLKNDVLS